jgi:acyl-coenzyme A synthetase/AMP-(fatty) acid ligase
VTSTGSVLSQDLYHWFYDQGFPPKAQLISMSGGTDIAGSCRLPLESQLESHVATTC